MFVSVSVSACLCLCLHVCVCVCVCFCSVACLCGSSCAFSVTRLVVQSLTRVCVCVCVCVRVLCSHFWRCVACISMLAGMIVRCVCLWFWCQTTFMHIVVVVGAIVLVIGCFFVDCACRVNCYLFVLGTRPWRANPTEGNRHVKPHHEPPPPTTGSGTTNTTLNYTNLINKKVGGEPKNPSKQKCYFGRQAHLCGFPK